MSVAPQHPSGTGPRGPSKPVEISVLMPVHNGETTIRRAVLSTLADLPTASELLIHDDACTDGTLAELERIRDPRMVVSSVATKVGVAAGLNGLLARARGRLVARMDADDVTLAGRFARERRALSSGDQVVFTSRINFGATWRMYRPDHTWPLSPELLRLWLLLENPLAHPTMLADAEVLRAAGGYVPGAAEDYELWLRLAVRGVRMRRLGTPGLLYRMHPGQVTRSAAWRKAQSQDGALAQAYTALAVDLGWSGGDVFHARFGLDRGEAERSIRRELRTFVDELGTERLGVPAAVLLRARASRVLR